MLVGWLVVFYVPSTARSFRDGCAPPFTVPCEGRGFYTVPTDNRTLNRHVAVHYTTAMQRQLHKFNVLSYLFFMTTKTGTVITNL